MLDWGYITASWDIAFAENKMSNSFFSLSWTLPLGAQSLREKCTKPKRVLKNVLGIQVQYQHWSFRTLWTNPVIFYQLLLVKHEMLILVSRALSWQISSSKNTTWPLSKMSGISSLSVTTVISLNPLEFIDRFYVKKPPKLGYGKRG